MADIDPSPTPSPIEAARERLTARLQTVMRFEALERFHRGLTGEGLWLSDSELLAQVGIEITFPEAIASREGADVAKIFLAHQIRTNLLLLAQSQMGNMRAEVEELLAAEGP